MSLFLKSNQKGQAAIEYIFILVFTMSILVSFINTFSTAIGRRVQGLSYTLTHFLNTGNCPNTCLFSSSNFDNDIV